MIGELKRKLKELEESRNTVNYALDMLEAGIGLNVNSDIIEELDSLIKFNNELAEDILAVVDFQESKGSSLDLVLENLYVEDTQEFKWSNNKVVVAEDVLKELASTNPTMTVIEFLEIVKENGGSLC